MTSLREIIKPNKKFNLIDLDEKKAVELWIICLVVVVDLIFSVIINLVIYRFGLFSWIYNITGFITPTMLAYTILYLVIIGLLMIYLGKLKPKDLGFSTSKLWQGVLIVIVGWFIIQIAGVIYSLIMSGTLKFDSYMVQSSAKLIIIKNVSQWVFNAPFEEFLFREFLITQLYLQFKNKLTNDPKSVKKSLTRSLIISQLIFSFMHIPNRILWVVSSESYTVKEIIWAAVNPLQYGVLIILGLTFALLYHRTDNIFIVIGIHSLFNEPNSLFFPRWIGSILIYVLAIILILFYPFFISKLSKEKEIVTKEDIIL
ncbi:MAG: CPBP family intramembrane metalloprotease [Candidatus Heimdallarchaeum endolithica]|uniref:CPBP family intramembrane metalloprotease n=1 Tax=Candidatus Heimdallarchaeum endolithica TaxID=2876572 RepID=A0A9Y1FPH7_9ARCH|nr:MAG: CPBP family intramembrane metalloprotease [Candidatus Heimdallarchaeum endolithica]